MSSRARGAARRFRDAARRRPAGQLAAGPHGRAGANASARAVPDERMWEVEERYRGRFTLEPLSYGTVRDWTDSVERIPGVASASFDMKNLQRCWMVKAVLGNVEPGGRLVEIGAGEPIVAGLLSRLGYEVTVVDPYDGSGNGPREYEAFRETYPDLDFVRDRFPPADGVEPGLGAVYSISVLEHIPAEVLGDVMRAARRLIDPQRGRSIHAIDHVAAGWSADEHLERLEAIVDGAGLERSQLRETLAGLDRDPDTYFVSAEAHDRWRGAIPYDEYPMRRIASVQLFAGA